MAAENNRMKIKTQGHDEEGEAVLTLRKEMFLGVVLATEAMVEEHWLKHSLSDIVEPN